MTATACWARRKTSGVSKKHGELAKKGINLHATVVLFLHHEWCVKDSGSDEWSSA